jgi:hypothetical protein
MAEKSREVEGGVGLVDDSAGRAGTGGPFVKNERLVISLRHSRSTCDRVRGFSRSQLVLVDASAQIVETGLDTSRDDPKIANHYFGSRPNCQNLLESTVLKPCSMHYQSLVRLPVIPFL